MRRPRLKRESRQSGEGAGPACSSGVCLLCLSRGRSLAREGREAVSPGRGLGRRGLEGAGREAVQPAGRRASPALRAHVTGRRDSALAVVQASEDGGREGTSSAGRREAHRL